MHYAYPNLIWLSILAAGGAGLAFYALWRKRQALRRLAGRVGAGTGLLVNRPIQAVKAGLVAGAALLLALVLLGPQWGRSATPTRPARGRDVLVIFDVSNSMLAEDMDPGRLANDKGVDVPPSRLNAAKADIRRLAAALEKKGGYRIGLIAFADRAVLLCPFTFDFRCFEEEVGQVSLDAIRVRGAPTGAEGTDIATALRRARELIDKQQTSYTDVFLFSDGGDMEPNTLDAADGLAEAGVAVHAVGLGDAVREAPIPVKAAGGLRTFLKDEQGETVGTRLEEDVLRKIAQRTHGRYLAVGTGALDVDRTLGDLLASKPTRELKKGGQGSVYIHRFQWFLAPALALLLLEMMLRDGRRKRTASVAEARYFPWRRKRKETALADGGR
jgi:Ca-activated chloride channel family protein